MQTFISFVPFVLLFALRLLVLGFVIYLCIHVLSAVQKKKLVDPLLRSIQTDILPEIRAFLESVDALRAEIKTRDENRGS